jgi:hypothetical protein
MLERRMETIKAQWITFSFRSGRDRNHEFSEGRFRVPPRLVQLPRAGPTEDEALGIALVQLDLLGVTVALRGHGWAIRREFALARDARSLQS